jgi:hypothetical protein
MTWIYNNTELIDIPESAIGFVYIITHIESNKKYIGKKNFYASVTRTKNIILKTTGAKKKKKIRSKKESDWKSYYGSSEELTRDILLFGKDAFRREILKICYTKGELSYYEAKYQFDHSVLLNPEMYYNSWIMVKVHRSHLNTKKSVDSSSSM